METYKIVIVDDEKIIRTGLASYDWKSLSFHVAGTARNGKEALELAVGIQPDVLITDIKMPIMDGLELTKKVMDYLPACKIIILSGYKEFDYAKTALQYGVYDYLLKPIDMSQMKNLFVSLKSKLDEERRRADLANVQAKKLGTLVPLAIDSLFRKLIAMSPVKASEVEETLALLEINVPFPTFACMTFELSAPMHESGNGRFLPSLGMTGEEWETDEWKAWPIPEKDRIAVAIHSTASSSMDDERAVRHIREITEKTSALIHRSNGSVAAVGIGLGFGNIQEIGHSYEQSVEAAKYASQRREPAVLFDPGTMRASPDKAANDLIREEIELAASVLEGNEERYRERYASFWRKLEQYGGSQSPLLARRSLESLKQRLSEEIDGLGRSFRSAAQAFEAHVNEMLQEETDSSSLQEALNRHLLRAVAEVERLAAAKPTSDLIRQSIRFIEDRHAEKVTLKQVAEHVYLTPNYFSMLFKKETGKNFIDYLKDFRIEKAKELLARLDLKVYEAGRMAGFHNAKYFTDMFKEYAGVTPLEYKRGIPAKGGTA